MARPGRNRSAAFAVLALTLLGCGSDKAVQTTEPPSPFVEDLIGALRATTDPAALPAFDAATPCLRETFAGYAELELQTIAEGITTQDLSKMTEPLRERFRSDALNCNEENRAIDAADYQADAAQEITDSGVTSVQCELPADISVGATFQCTGNFENRTREFEVTIDAEGHVAIERTD